MDSSIAAVRARIAETGAALRKAPLDTAGGNISARVVTWCITPLQRAEYLKEAAQDVMVSAWKARFWRAGRASRIEGSLKLHREFGEHGTAVIHAHSRNMLVFAAMGRPIPPVLEATRKFGEVPVIPYAPAHSVELSEHVAAAIRSQEARIGKQAAAVIAPYHGLFLIGKDLDSAADAVSASHQRLLHPHGAAAGGSDMLAEEAPEWKRPGRVERHAAR
jgi:L-fuculose-phosphate aldolase